MNIIVIEDDPDLLESLTMLLNKEGYPTNGVRSLASFTVWQQTHHFDLVILDRMLPDGDGLSLLQVIEPHISVIVLTGKTDTVSRIEGFDADVDHYIAKPVNSNELLAIIRQCQRKQAPDASAIWLLNKVTWEIASRDKRCFKLTNNEFRFVSAFVERAGLVINREELAEALGQDPKVYDYRRMEVLIKRLREKFTNNGFECPLQNAYGKGYSFNEPINWIGK